MALPEGAIPALYCGTILRGVVRARETRIAIQRRRIDDVVFEPRLLEALVAHASVGLFACRPDGTVIHANQSCCSKLGRSEPELLGDGWVRALHPDDRDCVLAKWAGALEAGEGLRAEYRFCRPDGSVVWVSDEVVAIREGGTLVGYVGALTDITERKAAERLLAEGRHRTQAVLDASPLAILSVDPQGRITGWNGGAERMLGWTEAEVLGRTCPTLSGTELEEFLGMVRRVLAGESVRGKVRYCKRKTGESLHAAISAGPLRDAAGVATGVVMVVDDITEREQTLERLRALVEDRERLMQDLHDSCIQSIFAIGLSLESSLKLLRRSPRKAAAGVGDAVANLNLVIQDLRSFIAGRQAPLAPHKLRDEIIRAVEAAGTHGPKFAVLIEPEALERLDAEQALQLMHISREGISNILRHARARAAQVSLSASREGVRLELNDDGAGFDAAARANGGLGLHHIEARVRRLRGRWRIASAPGKGTRVVVELPRRP